MARRKTSGRSAKRKTAGKAKGRRRSVKRQKLTRRPAKRAVARKTTKRAAPKPIRRSVSKPSIRKPARKIRRKPAPPHVAPARLERERRMLDEIVPTPPSSLDMKRQGSAARTGRAEMAQTQANHASMTPDISAGDVDVNVEDAYFSGDESPGGDNTTPDQDVVDEIGKALGVEYQDSEELRASDKVAERDKHRWELDPASSEDYRDRKK
jgi:Family of unknown function (DUF6335)